MKKLCLFLNIILMISSFPSVAQEILKHPRVVELEDRLNRDASEYIKARFPSIPFMVAVSVDPLRREVTKGGTGKGEGLPFYDDAEESEEIKDEWDNPQVPLMGLINRVKRIRVSIAVPSKLQENEVNELKEGIVTILHLTPARDEVQIDRRPWASDEIPWAGVAVAITAVFCLLVGLLLINRSSVNRIARALADLKSLGGQNQSGPIPTAPIGLTENDGKSGKRSQSQEVKFNDPIKMKELANRHIEFLSQSKMFPNRHDIFQLDKFGLDSPEKLGAILAEFPAEMQRKIFAYGSGFHWIEALNEPGFLDFECLEVLQNLTQNLRTGDDLGWDQAVLAVWRLNEQRNHFLKGLQKDEAFALLSDMPKAVGVSEARKAFPGAWASILEPTFKGARVPARRIAEIHEAARRLSPLNDIEMVKKYRSERDLLDYLKTTDPSEERDIYGAAREDSLIHKMRPPFFVIFDQSNEILNWFVPRISTEHWALALFNVPKGDRAKVDAHFTEKQKFFLIDRFKRFDVQPPTVESIGQVRENIGAALEKFLNEKTTADKANNSISDMFEDNENEKRAA